MFERLGGHADMPGRLGIKGVQQQAQRHAREHGYIDQLPDGWSILSGDVLAAGADGTATDLAIGPEGIAPTTGQDGASSPPPCSD